MEIAEKKLLSLAIASKVENNNTKKKRCLEIDRDQNPTRTDKQPAHPGLHPVE